MAQSSLVAVIEGKVRRIGEREFMGQKVREAEIEQAGGLVAFWVRLNGQEVKEGQSVKLPVAISPFVSKKGAVGMNVRALGN